MGSEVSGSNHIIQRMLAGAMPGTPDVYIPIVDVRDVARAHLLAMTTPDAAGQRFLVANGRTMPLWQIAATLRERLGEAAAKVPTRRIPSLVVRLAALVNPEFRAVLPDLGFARQVSAAKAERVLGWTGRPPEESIVAAGESLVAKGLVG
jgi:nucleoside-diphosphate-sugar epimerase